MTPEAIRDGFQTSARRARDARPRGRRPLPERERLAHRHQRHARDHQTHVRFARRQRRLGRPRADADARDRLRARAGDPQFQAARLLARDREIRNRQGRIRRRLSAPGFQEGNDDEHDRIDRIWDKAAAEAVVAACQGQPLADVTEEKKASSQIAPRLYDLTTLQREANGRFGFSAKRTLQIAQALYERHKMMTYPRTDSRALPEDYMPTVRQTLANLSGDLADARAKGARRTIGSGRTSASSTTRRSPITSRSSRRRRRRRTSMRRRRRFTTWWRGVSSPSFFPRRSSTSRRVSARSREHKFKTEGQGPDRARLARSLWARRGHRRRFDGRKGAARAEAGRSRARRRRSRPTCTRKRRSRRRATRKRPCSPRWKRAGKLVDDEELADAMKERGLGTPATRADTIDGLIYQKYMDRNQRELVPTAKAEQLIQFLEAVKAADLTSPAMTGEWEHQVAPDGAREISAREIHGRHRRGDERHRRAGERISRKTIPIARETDIISPTDSKPLRETLRGYKSQDGEFMIYKVIGGRQHGGVGEFASWSRKARSVRSTDSSRRKRGPVSPPSSSWRRTRRPGNGKPNTISATRSISARSSRSGPIPRRARNCAKSARITSCARTRTASGNRASGFRD